MTGKQYLVNLMAQMSMELANQCDELAARNEKIATLEARVAGLEKPKKKARS